MGAVRGLYVNGRDEEVAALEHVLERVGRCLGSTIRDTNRAYRLGADELGMRYKDASRMFKYAGVKGAAYAVDRDPGLIRFAPRVNGHVYFAKSNCTLFKIGYSAAPLERVMTISRMYGVPLAVVATRPGNLLDELAYHIAARPAWVGGEFYSSDKLFALPSFAFLNAVEEAA